MLTQTLTSTPIGAPDISRSKPAGSNAKRRRGYPGAVSTCARAPTRDTWTHSRSLVIPFPPIVRSTPVRPPVITPKRCFRALRPISPDDSRLFQHILSGEHHLRRRFRYPRRLANGVVRDRMETRLAAHQPKSGQSAFCFRRSVRARVAARDSKDPKSKSPGCAEFVAVKPDGLLLLFKRLIFRMPTPMYQSCVAASSELLSFHERSAGKPSSSGTSVAGKCSQISSSHEGQNPVCLSTLSDVFS
jgi:hypothetical protein